MTTQEFRLRGDVRWRRQLIDCNLNRDVLLAHCRQIVDSSRVPGVRAQPLAPRPLRHRGRCSAVVEHHQATAFEQRRSTLHPHPSTILHCHSCTVSCSHRQTGRQLSGRHESFDEPSVVVRDIRLLPSPVLNEESEWKVVEQLVGDDDTGEPMIWHGRRRRNCGRVHGSLRRREFHGPIRKSTHAARLRSNHAACQGAGPRTSINHDERVWPTKFFPPCVKRAGNHCAKEWAHLGGCEKVAASPGLTSTTSEYRFTSARRLSRVITCRRARVEPVLAIQRNRNELIEANRPTSGGDCPPNVVSRRKHQRAEPRHPSATPHPAGCRAPAWPLR